MINTSIARETVAAWDAAEARAPLDPRFSAGEGENVLFSRALLNTRLNTRDLEQLARYSLKLARRAADFHREPPLVDIPPAMAAQTLWVLLR